MWNTEYTSGIGLGFGSGRDSIRDRFRVSSRQNVVVYARMLTYNDEEPWPQNLGAVAIAN